MMRSLNTASTGMVAQQNNLDIIANNLANVNTQGYKAQRAEFEDLMYQTIAASGAQASDSRMLPGSLQVGLGVRFSGSGAMFKEGALIATNAPEDLAIVGDGFFKVQLPDGSDGFTRDGNFKLDSNGLLTTGGGNPLQPEITIPTGAQSITISRDGIVSGVRPGDDEPTEFGRITIAMFANPAGLTRIGQNLFKAGGASGEAQDVTPGQQGSGEIQQGFLEGSNVEIVQEMVRMILAQRAYEINSKAIQTADDMLNVVNSLKR